MIYVWELKTKNGRIFRTITENKNQEKRLSRIVSQNKEKDYEQFISVKVINNGIHSLRKFEKIAKTLI